ncbi:hypothetical protein QWY86_17375 [Pedobacter aquatilis]|nr:hypothetical protein [Pedobacter aquatilis]
MKIIRIIEQAPHQFAQNLHYFAAGSLESIRGSSSLYEHCEAIVNFDKALKNKIEGQYRKKKLM